MAVLISHLVYRMVIFVPLLAYLMVILATISAHQMDLGLECTNQQPSCQAYYSVDIALTINTKLECGECSLYVATSGHAVELLIETPSIWGPFHYLYINQTSNLLGLTAEETNGCSVRTDQNKLQAYFHMAGTLRFQAIAVNSSLPCHSFMHWAVSHNCQNLHQFDEIHRMNFSQVEIIQIGGDVQLPNYVLEEVWPVEFRAELPRCPDECVCSLHLQRFVANCNNVTTVSNLLVYPKTDLPGRISLDASNRQIVEVGDNAFMNHEYLNGIYLHNNLLTDIKSGTFQRLRTQLDPDDVLAIDLSGNKLAQLRADIFQNLFTLAYVGLSKNTLRALPDTLFRSQRLSLRLLDLSHNFLSELSLKMMSDIPELLVFLVNDNNLLRLEPDVFQNQKRKLSWLFLQDNKLQEILPQTFAGFRTLRRLNITNNQLRRLESGLLDGLYRLKELIVNGNQLTFLPMDLLKDQRRLLSLELEDNKISDLDFNTFRNLEKLKLLKIGKNKLVSLRLSNSSSNITLWPNLVLVTLQINSIETIESGIFYEMPQLKLIDLRGNPMRKIEEDSFESLGKDAKVSVDEASTCCFVNERNNCSSENPQAPFLTCQRLLPNIPLRMFMWIIGFFAFFGNLSVLIWRCIKRGHEKAVQVLLIENLAISDMLMGLYMLIVASADAFYQQYFPSYADGWREGFFCKLAGVLSVLSSEASVFFITLISIDRFVSIKNLMRGWRLTKKSVSISLAVLWTIALLLSILPTTFSGELQHNFYDVSEVCIGLPFVRSIVYSHSTRVLVDYDFTDFMSLSSLREVVYEDVSHHFKISNSSGLFFSIAVFLGLNLICFVLVALCYIGIFVIYKRTRKQAGKGNLNEELNLAVRMGVIVLSDFTCWMPIIIIGILVQANALTISPIVYVYIVVFVLPINSAANPFLYTMTTIVADYKKTRSKARISTQSNQRPIKPNSTSDTAI